MAEGSRNAEPGVGESCTSAQSRAERGRDAAQILRAGTDVVTGGVVVRSASAGSLRAKRFPSPRAPYPRPRHDNALLMLSPILHHAPSFRAVTAGGMTSYAGPSHRVESAGSRSTMMSSPLNYASPVARDVNTLTGYSADSASDRAGSVGSHGAPYAASRSSVSVAEAHGVTVIYPPTAEQLQPHERYDDANGANMDLAEVPVEGYYARNLDVLIPNDLPRSTLLYVLTASDGRDLMFKLIQYTLQLTICFLKTPALFSPEALAFTEPWAERFYRNYNTIRHGRSLFKMGRGLLNLFTLQTVCERLWLRYRETAAPVLRALVRPALRSVALPTLHLCRVLGLHDTAVGHTLTHWLQPPSMLENNMIGFDNGSMTAVTGDPRNRLGPDEQLLTEDLYLHVTTVEAERCGPPRCATPPCLARSHSRLGGPTIVEGEVEQTNQLAPHAERQWEPLAWSTDEVTATNKTDTRPTTTTRDAAPLHALWPTPSAVVRPASSDLLGCTEDCSPSHSTHDTAPSTFTEGPPHIAFTLPSNADGVGAGLAPREPRDDADAQSTSARTGTKSTTAAPPALLLQPLKQSHPQYAKTPHDGVVRGSSGDELAEDSFPLLGRPMDTARTTPAPTQPDIVPNDTLCALPTTPQQSTGAEGCVGAILADDTAVACDDSDVSVVSQVSNGSEDDLLRRAELVPAAAAEPARWRKGVLHYNPLLMALLGLRSIAAGCRRFLRDATLVSTEQFIRVDVIERHRRPLTRRINHLWFIVAVIDLLLNTVRLLHPGWVRYAKSRHDLRYRCGCRAEEDREDLIVQQGTYFVRLKKDLFFPALNLDYGAPIPSTIAYFEAADPSRMMPACSRCGYLYKEPGTFALATVGESPARSPLLQPTPTTATSAKEPIHERADGAATSPRASSVQSPDHVGIMLIPWLLRKWFDYVWLLRNHANFRATVLLEIRYLAEFFLAYKYCFGNYEYGRSDAPLSRILNPYCALAGMTNAAVGLLRVIESAPK